MASSLTWVALFFTLVAGIASAQTQQSVVTADAAGDVASSSPGIEAFNFMDIVEARVAIDNASLVLTWKVNDLSKHPQTIGASAEFWTEFVYSGTTYQAVVEIFGDELQSQGLPGDIFGLAEGRLFRQDEAWTDLATGDAQYVPASSEVVMTIALDAVRTVTELTPGPGEFIRVVQSVGYWDDDNTNSHDKPPAGRVSYRDDAEFAGAELVLPGSTLPGIAISTTHQVRYSNGEATTFQWPVQITNNRDEDVTLDVVASADQGITPKIPSVVQVEAGKSARFNAYATVPFAHEHGGQRTLNLGMSDDAGSTTFKLTIAYVDPPQPAGHHNTLWIHGAQGGSGRLNGAWINTLAEDPTATSDPIPTDVGSCLVNNAEVSGDGWLIPLLPKLTLGIDGNIDQPVTLQAALDVASTLPPGTVHAELLIYDEDKWTEARRAPLVPSDRTGKVAVEQAGPGQVPVELELRLPEIMDLMAPQANANLALRVVYCPDVPAGADIALSSALQFGGGLRLIQGGTLDLPLNEYRDPINLEAAADSITLSPAENRMHVAPGKQVLWTVTAAPALQARWEGELIGTNVETARIAEGTSFDADDDFTFHVIGVVPDDARDGDIYEVIVNMQADGNPATAAAVRLTAIVDSTSTADFDQAIAQLGGASKDAPGLAAPLSAMALLASLALRRKTS